jgi:SAM-dependent methyltransferase
MRLQNREKNFAFRKKHPDISLPPDYTLYESFLMDYAKYYEDGFDSAQELVERVSPFCNCTSGKILDWGCGPARILRHLPNILGYKNQYFGTDYNPNTINWCKANIPGINFSINQINPPLPYQDQYFDLVYGFSVFTHLSEENHLRWSDELQRIIKPEGVVLVTTHGDAFLERLTTDEQMLYQRHQLVPRTKVKEGHRMYAAFQPPAFMRKVFTQSGFKVVDHIAGKKVNAVFISQDVWLLKRLTDTTV